MKLIIGLGNPGILYRNSRHNVGFLVVKALAKEHKAILKKDFGATALSFKFKFAGENIVVAQPLTFMNLSGKAVGELVKKYKIEKCDLLIVCDDLDLELGRLKVNARGSSAGHNGLKSIIASLGSEDFARVRLGIGRPPKYMDGADYVLGSFKRCEAVKVKEAVKKAAECVEFWVSEGIEKTMNIFNRRE